MQCKVRRVPLDFDWPLNQPWKGYENPHLGKENRCKTCEGYPVSPLGRAVENFCRRLGVVAEDSSRRPDGYTPNKSRTFQEAMDALKSVQGAYLNPMYAYMSLDRSLRLPSLPAFLGGLEAVSRGEDPDREEDEPMWGLEADPVEVLTAILTKMGSAETINEGDVWIIRRIARKVPYEGAYSPQHCRQEWEFLPRGERRRRFVLDPKADCYYPHPYTCEGSGIGDPGSTLWRVYEALPGNQGFNGYSSNCWKLIEQILHETGHATDEYTCPDCDDGFSHAVKALADAWEETEPPEGPGWQMWETCSEGSPISPVFETAEELAGYLAKTQKENVSADGWLRVIHLGGSSFSWVGITDEDGTLTGRSGVEVLAAEPEKP